MRYLLFEKQSSGKPSQQHRPALLRPSVPHNFGIKIQHPSSKLAHVSPFRFGRFLRSRLRSSAARSASTTELARLPSFSPACARWPLRHSNFSSVRQHPSQISRTKREHQPAERRASQSISAAVIEAPVASTALRKPPAHRSAFFSEGSPRVHREFLPLWSVSTRCHFLCACICALHGCMRRRRDAKLGRARGTAECVWASISPDGRGCGWLSRLHFTVLENGRLTDRTLHRQHLSLWDMRYLVSVCLSFLEHEHSAFQLTQLKSRPAGERVTSEQWRKVYIAGN